MANGNENTNKRDRRRVETRHALSLGRGKGGTNIFLPLTGLPEFGLSGMGLKRLWLDPVEIHHLEF